MTTLPFRTIVASGLLRTHTNAVEYDASRAIQGRTPRNHKILICGIKLSTGTLAELVPQRVYQSNEGDALWGTGSQIAEMVRAAKKNNATTEMWGIGIDQLSGGTAGTKTLTVTASGALAGTLHLYIDGQFYVPVAVTDAMAQNDIATAINAAIQAHGEYGRMPFTSGVATNVVTLTMKWKGVDVADARFNYDDGDAFPSGVSVAVAAAVAGAGNPDITEIITAIAADTYDTIIVPWIDSTNMTALKTELTRRWGGQVKQWGHCFIASAQNHADSITTGNAHNNPHLSYFAANLAATAPWNAAAIVGAIDAGESNPAMPRNGRPLLGFYPPARSAVWTDAQRNTLLFEGVSTYVLDGARQPYIERLTTTYKANAQSVEDWTFLDVETPRTLAAIMYDLDTSVALRFPRHLLQDDGGDIPAGLPVVTPKRMAGHILSRFDLWVAAGWVESSSREQFIEELLVIRPDDSRTRLEADLGPNLMNQFRGLSAKVAFIL
jgi:phage tail sheath gpL-like